MKSFLSNRPGIISAIGARCPDTLAGLPTEAGGFTLIELLIVIAILGTLAGIAIPVYASYRNQAKITAAKAEIKTIEKEILAFYTEYERLPNNLAEIGLSGIKDPYGNPYQYMPAPSNDSEASKNGGGNSGNAMRKDRNLHPVNTDFDLYSMGKDGKSSAPFTAKISQDDIVRANNGQFVGLVSVY